MNLKSFLIGLSLGLSGKPLPISGGEPVAYLYNGVRLPPLPESDLPYASIHTSYSGGKVLYRILYLSGHPVTSTTDGFVIPAPWKVYYFRNSYVEWNFNLSNDANDVISTRELLWANHDVLNEDGSVYLAASEPIPVYD